MSQYTDLNPDIFKSLKSSTSHLLSHYLIGFPELDIRRFNWTHITFFLFQTALLQLIVWWSLNTKPVLNPCDTASLS